MRVKRTSKKLISALLSLSMIASLFVSSGINASAESSDEEFSPSWNYTRNCSIKKADGSSENIQISGLPQTGIFFHINDLNNDLEHPVRVKFSISSNKPLVFGYVTGTFEDIDTDTSDDWSTCSFKNNNSSISLIGADGNGVYEWNSNYYEYSGGVISIPFFKGDISESDIVRAVKYGWEDDLSEYLSNDYSVNYEITVQDMYGRIISHFDKYDEVNVPEDLSVTLTTDEENGKSAISGALATDNYNGATVFDSSAGIYAELSANKKTYPIYADDETKLPNYGIIADLSSVDFSKYPDSKLVVKFNPNGDKKLNSQADNYNDSAVKLSASTGIWNGNAFKTVSHDKTVTEAYPDSNSYQYSCVVPIDQNNNVVVFRIFPGGSSGIDEKYLSSVFNFSYEISLEDKYGRTIKSYSKDGGEVKTVSSNYIACGTLSDVDNPIDKWVINLNDGTGTPPDENTGGLKFEFVGDIPEDFDYSQLSVKLQLADRNSCNGYSAFGYSKTKTGTDSLYKSGAVLDYKVKYNNNGYLASQDRVGYGDDRISEIDFSTENSWGYRTAVSVSDSKAFSIIPEACEYSFNYKISSKNLKYKFEIDSSNVVCSDEDNIISSSEPVSSKGTALHTIKLRIVYRDDASDKSSIICSDKSGLPNWGILYDYSNILPESVKIKSDEYMSFVVDEYLPTSEPLKYFVWSQGGSLTGDVPYNVDDTDGSEYYNKDNMYFLAKRLYSDKVVKNNETLSIEVYSQDVVYPQITEIDASAYDSNTLDFELNGKYYHPEVTEISQRDYTSQNYEGYAFQINSKYWLINSGKEVFPIISIRPVIEKYAPSSYKYSYYIDYDNTDYEMSKVIVWHYKAFEDSNFSFYPNLESGRAVAVHGSVSETDTLSNDDGFSLFKISTRDAVDDYTSLDTLIKLYDGSTSWIDKASGKYVGKFNISDVKNGLLVTVDSIIDKVNENPYVNVDLRLPDNAETAKFTSIFGEIKDGVFYIKEQHTGDYATNVKQSFDYSYPHTEGGGILSSEYTYTLHAHLNENEAICIFPNEKSVVFDYEISTRNISQYNIDSLVDEPTGNIERIVGNNIIYKGSTEATRLQEVIQKALLTFKSYKNTNTTDNTYQKDDVKYVPVRLFDYNFTGKQTSEFQFLYNTQSTSGAPQNTWHDGVYSNIVENEIDYSTDSFGLPKFRFSTPFNNLFNITNETDENGNTKTAYDTVLELSYDEENQMYHYNSLLHAATYDSERNAILTYQSALGIDCWGMRGAGFFPFNSFSDEGEWGTSSKYNANTYLIDEKKINYHFGMGMSLDFVMPENSKTLKADGTSSDIIYKFTGDDDVWVFVDDKLVLDLGGIHEAITGTINLTQGTYSIGSKVYELSSVLSSDFSAGTKHNIKMFYLERGGTLSNCSIQFNIPIENNVPTYKLSYDSNGATSGETPIDDTPYFENELAKVINDSGTAERKGYRFMGWAIKSDSTDSISTIKMESDKTVYAIWKELEHLELPVTGSNSELMLIVAGILLTGTGVILLIRKRKSRKL